MALFTKNLGLKVWNNQSDKYNYQELARNWLKVDDHDHSSGNGKQIPTDGIADGSITTRKLDQGLVNQIVDQVNISRIGAVNTSRIDDKAVTSNKLSPYAKLPLGSIVPWFWPTTPTQANLDAAMGVASNKPSAWKICNGDTLVDGHDFGTGSVTLPNLQDKFIQGASTTNSVNGVGGSAELDLQHTHVFDHIHVTPAHWHVVTNAEIPDHKHGSPRVGNASYEFIVKGSGNKYFYDNSPPSTQKVTQFDSFTVTGDTSGSKKIQGWVGGSKTLGSKTLSSGDSDMVTSGPKSASNSANSTKTDNAVSNKLTNPTDFAKVENRPPYVSLTYIIKVLNNA